MTSDLQSDSAASDPDWPELDPRPGDPDEAQRPGDGDAGEGLSGEGLPDGGYGLPRRRSRFMGELGRVWYRPGGEPRAQKRPPLRERLVPPYYPEFFPGAGWILPLLVTVLGGVMRFWDLARPNQIIFDETYYAKDAWSMYIYGWEHTWSGVTKNGNNVADTALSGSGAFGHNGVAMFGPGPEYVVHPPAGKWIIGAGEQIWGLNPVGWRLMEAVLGTLAIYILARAARRMFRSTLLGVVAGIFMSYDGLAFVMARTALLDGIQMFFILGGFAALLVDRDKTREKLADWRDAQGSGLLAVGEYGPKLGFRTWRLIAGLSLGVATATKWNGIFFVAAFALMSMSWDWGARRALGVRVPYALLLGWPAALVGVYGVAELIMDAASGKSFSATPNRIWISLAVGVVGVLVLLMRQRTVAGFKPPFWRFLRDAGWTFAAIPVTTAGVFLASYAGWFFDTSNGGGYNRFWANSHPSDFWPTWTGPFRSLWNYVYQQYQFNTNLESPHLYMSNPWSWLIMGRPVAFYYESPAPGTGDCAADAGKCSAEVLALGNPLLWWFASAGIVFLLWRWIGRRDWRASAILVGIAAGLLPWMHYAERTIFSFYAIAFAPFMFLSATMLIGAILGRADAAPTRRVWGAAVSGTIVIAVVLLFAYFYPILSGESISYSDWASHMWLPSWI